MVEGVVGQVLHPMVKGMGGKELQLLLIVSCLCRGKHLETGANPHPFDASDLPDPHT